MAASKQNPSVPDTDLEVANADAPIAAGGGGDKDDGYDEEALETGELSSDELEFFALHDSLTHLPNRLQLRSRLDNALAAARRAREQLALIFLDLDHFKDVNDSLGHAARDQLLVAVAERLRTLVRGEDTVARVSGDEFVILLTHLRGAGDAAVSVRKILRGFREPFTLGEAEVPVRCSLGVALFPDDGATGAELIRAADAAMYLAKDAGRNTFRFVREERSEDAAELLRLERALRDLLDSGGEALGFVYQPIVELGSRKLAGLEALARCRCPGFGEVAPERFIGVAVQAGLVQPLGSLLVDRACAQAKAWLDEGREFGAVALNLHPAQLRDPSLVVSLGDALVRHGLDPARIELELGEEALTKRLEPALYGFVELGVGLVFDDLSRGSTRLGALARLPVRKFKLSRAHVAMLPGSAEQVRAAELVVAVAQTLGCPVVAVGVERPGQEEVVRAIGVTLGQGYRFARPRPAAEIFGLA